MRTYLDTSALVKLVVAEPESSALKRHLGALPGDGLFTAALARTELIRAVARNGARAIADARQLLDGIDSVNLTRRLLDDAGTILPSGLRSLDAIHLAAAQRAGTALRAVVTYDLRMLSAAADLGMATASPD
ncbi:nucleic acid-binding protein [Mycobacterium vulneris]|uniref:Ribonuclease VapC n=1 Tax=Mycolicibacterium septicum DSM 44393 TaxID=1341646 RepID=A0A7X6MVR9_9MYCO|nr:MULTISPECIES: type II toxin-antitoxin system VapC family toxin [Mycolicibacterium]MBX8686907.1 PIN domain-containing protein [Mycobacterium sp. 20091114027_K0903767]MCP3810868.1 type II toxin-antitoxin system VapC family toxin [Mycobacteriaceae bacterium Msp059]OCB47913.1 nucleic acid-binding protein [Mycolicibacterium vulneris]NKZ14941.1 type II toxin-antitoxin system VapC family toxin [Mycolicibacterium septicum DSM 44393]OBK07210.1 nucleic acid-binding protein [Mycolicibacterium fortuitu